MNTCEVIHQWREKAVLLFVPEKYGLLIMQLTAKNNWSYKMWSTRVLPSADYCVELLLFVLVLCKTSLPPTTETERTLIESFNFEDSLQSLYAWMPVLHGVRSDTQLWTLILQMPAFKQKGRKPFYELKVIQRSSCSFTNSVLWHLQLRRGQNSESMVQYVVQWLGLFSTARSWKPKARS